jgi:hypothetical protein
MTELGGDARSSVADSSLVDVRLPIRLWDVKAAIDRHGEEGIAP